MNENALHVLHPYKYFAEAPKEFYVKAEPLTK